jgi:hypothetical protein
MMIGSKNRVTIGWYSIRDPCRPINFSKANHVVETMKMKTDTVNADRIIGPIY